MVWCGGGATELVNRYLSYKIPFDLHRLKTEYYAAAKSSSAGSGGSSGSGGSGNGSGSDTKSIGGGSAAPNRPSFDTCDSAYRYVQRTVPTQPKPHPVDWDNTKQAERAAAEAAAEAADAADELAHGEKSERAKRRRTKWMLFGLFGSIAAMVLLAKWRKSALGITDEAMVAAAAAEATQPPPPPPAPASNDPAVTGLFTRPANL